MSSESFKPPRRLTTPVLFLVFNRPDTTKQVFEAIRQAKPQKLFVAADGPRIDRPEEKEKCARVRGIATAVDWDCEVKTLFQDENIGCKMAVSTAIDWFFEQEPEGIILEDDCLPHPTFFHYCKELLEKYRNDECIAMIGGSNFQFGRKRTPYSYYFSRYTHIWGWASWRRAWQDYDVEIKLWPVIRDNGWLEDILDDSRLVKYWGEIFQSVYNGKIDTWDYQWTLSCWIQNGLTILPNVNLISNIGFNADATHTTSESRFANITAEEMVFPLQSPPFVIRDTQSDRYTDKTMFKTSLFSRVNAKIKSFLA